MPRCSRIVKKISSREKRDRLLLPPPPLHEIQGRRKRLVPQMSNTPRSTISTSRGKKKYSFKFSQSTPTPVIECVQLLIWPRPADSFSEERRIERFHWVGSLAFESKKSALWKEDLASLCLNGAFSTLEVHFGHLVESQLHDFQ